MTIEETLLTTLLTGRTDRKEEAEILALLRDLSAERLDLLLSRIDCAELFSSVDDRIVGPDHRTDLRQLLIGRLGDLGIRAQANLAYGLQAHHTDRADEEAIRDIFLSRTGAELTLLKNQMNARLDAHDLEGMVFSDIDDETIRQEILLHIKEQALHVETDEAKVLCDIDDTVICALHDDRYPKGTIYPGVLALLSALDAGPSDAPFSSGDLTFVTARPGDALGLIENRTRATLRRAGIATHSVLTGTLRALVTHDLMAGQKVTNVQHYRQLFPEYRLLFIGDSGQGDIRVGQMLLEQMGDVVDAVAIHDVVGKPAEERQALAAEGVVLVDTYIGAANLMLQRGLISLAGRERVVAESRQALDGIPWETPEQRAHIEELIERDAAAVTSLGESAFS